MSIVIEEKLRERVHELESECLEQARLNGMGSEREARLMAQLAESQVREAKLRESLAKIASIENELYGGDWDEIESARGIANEALTMPHDDTALKEYRRKVLLEAVGRVALAEGKPGNVWCEGYTAATRDHAEGLRRMANEQ